MDSGQSSPFWRRLLEARREHVPPLPSRQQDVAKSAGGIYQSAVTKWKTGEGFPTLDKCLALAREAGVCVEWLLTGRGPKRPADVATDPMEIELLELYRRCDQDNRHWLLQTAKLARTGSFNGDPAHRSGVQQEMVAKTKRAATEKPHK